MVWLIKGIKKTFFGLYEYTENDKQIRNVFSNIADFILLFVYAGISYYNGKEKMAFLQGFTDNIETCVNQDATLQIFNILLESGAVWLVCLNLIVLMRNHINLYKKVKKYKEDYITRQRKKKRVVAAVRFPAWQGCLGIIKMAYLVIVVVLLCVYITGNNIIHPISLVAFSTTTATLLLGLIADMENFLHIQPIAYEERRGR